MSKFGVNSWLTLGYAWVNAIDDVAANNAYATAIQSLQTASNINYASYDAYSLLQGLTSGYGNSWNKSTDRIRWYVQQVAAAGGTWIREHYPVPRYFHANWLTKFGAAVTPTAADGWEALDALVDECQKQGVKLLINIPDIGWGGIGVYGYSSASVFQNNFAIPYVQFVAARYAAYTGTVWIEPGNEGVDGIIGYGSTGASYQVAIYNAVKAVSTLPVTLLSSAFPGSVSTLLSSLVTLGTVTLNGVSTSAINAFDDYFHIHLYTDMTTTTYSSAYGKFQQASTISQIYSYLAAHGRTTTPRWLYSEFGIALESGGGPNGTVTWPTGVDQTVAWQHAADYIVPAVMDYAGSDSNCDAAMLWNMSCAGLASPMLEGYGYFAFWPLAPWQADVASANALPSPYSGYYPATTPGIYDRILAYKNPVAPTVAPNPLPGSYASGTYIVLTPSQPGAIIYFTLDGTTPTTASPQYTNTTIVDNASVLKFFAAWDGTTTAVQTLNYSVGTGGPSDTTAPTVTGFSMPSTASSLTVAVTTLTATDNVGVTGYLITESATPPSAGAAGWSGTAPTSFTFSAAGAKTAYAWAKDAAGNVSAAATASVTITLPGGHPWKLATGATDTAPLKTATGATDTAPIKSNKGGTWQ